MASIECFSMLSLVFCQTSTSIWRNKVNIEIDVIAVNDDICGAPKTFQGYGIEYNRVD